MRTFKTNLIYLCASQQSLEESWKSMSLVLLTNSYWIWIVEYLVPRHRGSETCRHRRWKEGAYLLWQAYGSWSRSRLPRRWMERIRFPYCWWKWQTGISHETGNHHNRYMTLFICLWALNNTQLFFRTCSPAFLRWTQLLPRKTRWWEETQVCSWMHCWCQPLCLGCCYRQEGRAGTRLNTALWNSFA